MTRKFRGTWGWASCRGHERDAAGMGVMSAGHLAGSLPPEMRAHAVTPVRAEHAPENAMDEPGEVARFYDRCSDLMRELLDELAARPDRPRTLPAIEDAIGWPHRRIASVLGGVCHLRRMEFSGRRPYHFREPRAADSRRWELWMDGGQAQAVRVERGGVDRGGVDRGVVD